MNWLSHSFTFTLGLILLFPTILLLVALVLPGPNGSYLEHWQHFALLFREPLFYLYLFAAANWLSHRRARRRGGVGSGTALWASSSLLMAVVVTWIIVPAISRTDEVWEWEDKVTLFACLSFTAYLLILALFGCVISLRNARS